MFFQKKRNIAVLYKTLNMLAWESGFPAERQTCNSATTGTASTQKSLGIQFALCPGLSWVQDFLIPSSRLSSGKVVRSTSRNALCVNSATNPTTLRGLLILTIILMLSYLSSATGMPHRSTGTKNKLVGIHPLSKQVARFCIRTNRQWPEASLKICPQRKCVYSTSAELNSLFAWNWNGQPSSTGNDWGKKGDRKEGTKEDRETVSPKISTQPFQLWRWDFY